MCTVRKTESVEKGERARISRRSEAQFFPGLHKRGSRQQEKAPTSAVNLLPPSYLAREKNVERQENKRQPGREAGTSLEAKKMTKDFLAAVFCVCTTYTKSKRSDNKMAANSGPAGFFAESQ